MIFPYGIGLAIVAAVATVGVSNRGGHLDTMPTPTASSALESSERINYIGWYARWGLEAGCVGGPYAGQHPDLMDIWLVDENGGEIRLGETTHTDVIPGCSYHTETAFSNLDDNFASACDGVGCAQLIDRLWVEPHKHHPSCDH